MTESSTAGVQHLRLIPPPGDADVLDMLHLALHRSSCLRAAVAYTSGYEDIDIGLLANRTGGRGFLCVDIRKPTNLDWLWAVHEAGGIVLLNLRHPVDGYGEPKLPEGLLHSKTLLFDRDDGTAEAWVGSHNWSKRALVGPNFETSLIAELRRGIPLYLEFQEALSWIASVCEHFDPNLMDLYRQLQGEDTSDDEKGYLLSLYSDTVDDLESEAVTVFGTNREDLRGLPDVGSNLRVELTELGKDESKTLYDSTVLHRGLLGGSEHLAGGLSFAARRYAFRQERRRAQLHDKSSPPEGVVERAAYFVTVEITGQAVGLEVHPLKKPQVWQKTSNDPLLARMRPERRDRGRSRSPACVRVPERRVRQDVRAPEREVIERGNEPLVSRVVFRKKTR